MAGIGRETGSRTRVIRVFFTHGFVGFALLLWVTFTRTAEVSRILEGLDGSGPLLVLVFLVFCSALATLKFELTGLIYVSLAMTSFIAMFPLLGMVLSTWIAVIATAAPRIFAMFQIGPVKIDMSDPPVELVKTFGLFGTYGIPVLVASWLFEFFGMQAPVEEPTLRAVGVIVLSATALVLGNTILMTRVMLAYDYSWRKLVELAITDASIYLLMIPYSICVTYSYPTMGLGAVLGLAFTGVVMTSVARNLAVARSNSQQQLRRLASLSNIGKTISLKFTIEQLLMTIYVECKKVVDVSLFSIALLDEQKNELSFELDVREDKILPKERIPVGDGLNSWVVSHHRPLKLGSVKEERMLGLVAVEDGVDSESWLGVPMIARDRVVGVISVQSFRKNVFTNDDLMLLTSIANQAAVAIENAQLYKDLEGLTFALEQRVNERTYELREANLRLMAADRSKNQFLANMSHELRTPLNSIIGFSSVLIDSTKDVLAPRLYKFLENIHTAGHHLLELINDILDLSKIEAGRMELRPDTFDLRDTIASVERVMKGFAAEANVRIVTSVHPDIGPVTLDEGRLKQILFNLLSNAVKFSPNGGPVSITIDPLSAKSSPLPVDSIRIRVSDQGIGIAPAELSKIFDEFYQTEPARRAARKGGTGLGLSLTRNFVELHRGKIAVESVVDQGSTFTLFLPVNLGEVTHDALPPESTIEVVAPGTDRVN